MTTAPALSLLAELRDRGVELQARGERLRYRPVDAVDGVLLDRIRGLKPALLAILAEPDTSRLSSVDSRVEERLVRLLEGRLSQDRSGWWPKDTRLPPARAKELALETFTNDPPDGLPEPHRWVTSRGPEAVRSWRQVAGCLMYRLGWDADRASRAATDVVGTNVDPACSPRRSGA